MGWNLCLAARLSLCRGRNGAHVLILTLGELAGGMVVFLVIAVVLQNYGFYMTIAILLIEKHTRHVLKERSQWDSMCCSRYAMIGTPSLLFSFVWSLILLMIAGGWMNWNLSWHALSLGIPVIVQAHLATELANCIVSQQESAAA